MVGAPADGTRPRHTSAPPVVLELVVPLVPVLPLLLLVEDVLDVPELPLELDGPVLELDALEPLLIELLELLELDDALDPLELDEDDALDPLELLLFELLDAVLPELDAELLLPPVVVDELVPPQPAANSATAAHTPSARMQIPQGNLRTPGGYFTSRTSDASAPLHAGACSQLTSTL